MLLADAERAQAELRAYLGLDAGQLHMGLIQTSDAAIDVLDPIRRFHERFPAIEVHISSQPSAEMVQAVTAGTLDLAVVALARGPLIKFTRGSGLRRQVDEALRRAGLETDSRFELAQATDMLRFAAIGLGVTIVP